MVYSNKTGIILAGIVCVYIYIYIYTRYLKTAVLLNAESLGYSKTKILVEATIIFKLVMIEVD